MSRNNIIIVVIAAVLVAAGLVVTIRRASAASSTAYTFVAYGDIRPGSGATDSPYSSGWVHVRDRVIATPHAFDVIPGDVIQGLSGSDSLANDLAKYDWLFKNMGAEQSVPHVYAPGNHENFASATYRSAWEQKIDAAHWRAYSYGAGTAADPRTFVIQLSTEEPGYSGRIGLAGETSAGNSPQAKWLVSLLQQEAWKPNEYIVAVFHRGLADPKPGETMGDKAALQDLFTRYGVDLVINAHTHVYVRHMMPNGTPYLLLGNGGASLYGAGSWASTSPGTDVKSIVGRYGFGSFSLQTDGSMQATISTVDPSSWAWATSDTFTVPQTRPTAPRPTSTPAPTPTRTTPAPTATPTPAPTPSTAPGTTPQMTLRLKGLKGGAIKLGRRMTARGTVTPASLVGAHVIVSVQKKQGSRWVKTGTAVRTVTSASTFGWKFKPATRGAYRVRATILKTPTHAGARTTREVFRVK